MQNDVQQGTARILLTQLSTHSLQAVIAINFLPFECFKEISCAVKVQLTKVKIIGQLHVTISSPLRMLYTNMTQIATTPTAWNVSGCSDSLTIVYKHRSPKLLSDQVKVTQAAENAHNSAAAALGQPRKLLA